MTTERVIDSQKTWGWKLAAYLFLAGVSAGAYLVSLFIGWLHPGMAILSRMGFLLSAFFIILGILFLIWDLGKKPVAFRAFLQPISSWIARGSIIIIVFFILTLIQIGTGIWPFQWLDAAPGLSLVMEIITAIFGLLTLVYTGLVLGSAKRVPFWDIVLLPILFLISGVSTGALVLAFCLAVFTGSAGEPSLVFLARYDSFAIIIEILVIGFYVYRMFLIPGAGDSIRGIIKGNLATHFWGGVVVCGLLFPLVFELYMTSLHPSYSAITLIFTAIASVLGLFGGFMLRYIIVVGGTGVPLNINDIYIPLSKPKIKVYASFGKKVLTK